MTFSFKIISIVKCKVLEKHKHMKKVTLTITCDTNDTTSPASIFFEILYNTEYYIMPLCVICITFLVRFSSNFRNSLEVAELLFKIKTY